MALDLGELVAKMRVDDSQVGAGLERGQGRLKKFGKAVGVGLGAAGAAAGGMLAAGISTSIEREAIGDKFAAQYPNPELAKRAGEAAGSLYANAWGENLEQANQYVQSVVTTIPNMDKASAETVAKMTERFAALGQTFDLDVGASATAAGIMVRNGLAKDGAEAADQLTVALRKVPTVMREDLIDAVSEYSPYIADLGLSGGQALAVFIQWGAEGKVGIDKAGDALKEFGIRAADGSEASMDAFKQLGLSGERMTRGIAAGGDAGARAFEKTVDALRKVEDPAKQAQLAIALFGTPLEDIGTQNIPAFLDGLEKAKTGLGETKGAADQMAAAVGDNSATKIEMAKRQFEGWTTSMASGVASMGTFGAAALGIGPSLIGMLGPMAMMTMAIQGMNLAFLASPITWIILGLVALAVGLVIAYKKVGWFRDFVNVAFRMIKNIAFAIGAWFSGPFVNFFGTTFRMIGNAGKAVGSWFAGPFVGFFRAMGHAVMSGIRGLGNGISATWRMIRNAFDTGARLIARASRLGFLGPIPAIIANWGKITGFFRELPGKIMSYLSSLPGRMRNAGVAIIRSLADGMSSMASDAVDRVRGIVGDIASLIPGSPVKRGPLRVLNNGRAGRNIVRMLADGIGAEADSVQRALGGALGLPATAQASLGATRGGYGAGVALSRSQTVRVEFAGSNDPWMTALRQSVRVVGKGNTQSALGQVSTPVAVMG